MGKGFSLSLHEIGPYDKRIQSIYQWHPFIGLTFSPNCNFIGSHPSSHKRAVIFVDKHGFLAKDQTLEYEKPANEIRTATIGASTTANISLPFDENWPGYLGMLVRKHFPNMNIRVINAAVTGFDTAQSIGNLALRVMPFKPDIVIIYHAYNDLKAIRTDVTFLPDYSHFHTTPYGYHKKPNFMIRLLHNCMFYVRARNKYREYKSNVKKFDRLAKRNALKEDIKKRLSHIPQQAAQTFEQHIHALVSIAESEDAKVILSSFATLHDPKLDWSNPKSLERLSEFQKRKLYSLLHFTPGLTLEAIFDGFNQYNEVLKRIAVQEKTGWVDNASLVPHQDKYFLDRVHFSSEGAKQMAKNFLPVVLEKLKEQ